ncbi:MAG: ATPase domain-containing protein [Thermoplasmata archaeon]
MIIKSGIPGLDEMLGGGIPARTVNLICGPAGSAKTLFGMQFLLGGVKNGEKGIYITLEESRANIERAMNNYKFNLLEHQKNNNILIMDLGAMRKEAISKEIEKGMVNFSSVAKVIKNIQKLTNAKRCVVDSITALGLYYSNIEELRRELFVFATELKEMDMTSLLISESPDGTNSLTRYGIEQFVCDSFVVLGLEDVKGELRRTIMVRKMRFAKHDTTKHPIVITPEGIVIQADTKIF